MSPDEITRLARLHLVVNDDWRIFGVEAFARAIEQAAMKKAIEQIAEWYEKEGWLLDEDDVPAAIRALLPDSKEQPWSI